MRAIGYLFALTFLSVNAQVSTSVPHAIAEKLDAHHLYLDARLDKTAFHPFAYSDFREAAAQFGDSCTLYIAPGVYWVDDPDHPEVVTGQDGREPFGMVIRAKTPFHRTFYRCPSDGLGFTERPDARSCRQFHHV